jgi:hypothetical protein
LPPFRASASSARNSAASPLLLARCDGLGQGLGLAGSKHDRSALVYEYAVIEMAADCAREDYALEVTADAFEVLDRVPVTDSLDVLLDDRAGVELVGGLVRRRADELDAAFVRTQIRLGTCECR